MIAVIIKFPNFPPMIDYSAKHWYEFLFKFSKSDTIRQLYPVIIGICIYTAIVGYLVNGYWQLENDHYLKNITILHTVLGFVISLLLAFRTNTAYERWWEGRKLWGALVNTSRNLAVKLSGILPEDDLTNRKFFRAIVPQFAVALKAHLQLESTRLELDDALHPEFNGIEYEKHLPNQVQLVIFKKINELYLEGIITPDQYRNFNPDIQAFADICGACERIKNTPIPLSYSTFIRKFIFFYVMTMPWGYVFPLGYWAVPVVAFIFYVLASLEIIAEEIEDPFGTDQNDLPLQKIASNIEKHVGEII